MEFSSILAVNIAVAAAAYLMGNISPAILLGRMYGVDIKKEGSGNAGATNVLRVLGKKAAAVTLSIDVLKGVAAVLLGRYLGGEGLALVCGIAVFCGHIWPVFFKFKGGKGVATALGVILTTVPVLGAVVLASALVIIAISRRVSVGAITCAVAFPPVVAFYDREMMIWAIALGVIILITHRRNMVRLFKGEEPKLNFKEKRSGN